MESIYNFFIAGSGVVKFLATIAFSFIILTLLNHYLRAYWEKRKFQYQLLMLCLTLVAIIAVIIALPLSDTLRGQLLTLFGILLSGAIAFSSTTFIGNILAGFMLRAIKNIKLGDFITVNDITGRVTELNLLHVEIQTEQSDLITIPNTHMVTYPVKAVRSSGTIVSIDVSLGYNIPRQQVATQLTLASEDAGLTEGFVQIRNLGDFSITYRIGAHLQELSNLLSVRAKLYNAVLDRLHEANIEIVSPNFMNTRALNETPVIPIASTKQEQNSDNGLEKLAFEKAELASSIANIQTEIEQLTAALKGGKDTLTGPESDEIKLKVKALEQKLETEEEHIKKQDEQVEKT